MMGFGHDVNSTIVRPEHVALRTSYERRNTVAGNSERPQDKELQTADVLGHESLEQRNAAKFLWGHARKTKPSLQFRSLSLSHSAAGQNPRSPW